MKEAPSGIGIQALVSTVIIASMLVLAISLTAQSYVGNRDVLVAQLENSAQHVAKTINMQIEHAIQPIQSTIQLLELDPITTLSTLEERQTRLPVLAKVLKSSPILSSVYAGYADGDFFLLRTLNEDAKKRIQPPPKKDAYYLLQSVERHNNNASPKSTWLYFDKNLVLLDTRKPDNYQYDPRTRPWFKQAHQSKELVITSPYAFYTTKEAGITVALNNRQTQTVIGLDASIRDFSSIMKSLQPNNNTLIALIDSQQNVIGYPDADELIKSNGTDGYRLAKLKELGSPALTLLSGRDNKMDTLTSFNANGQRWMGMKVKLGEGLHSQFSLLFAIKESHLLSQANTHLKSQITWSAILILILLLCGWKLGYVISRPLKHLANEVDALNNFNFNRPIEVTSFIKELNALSHLTRDMASTIRNFQSISNELATDPDLENMLQKVLRHLVSITHCEAGAVYLYKKSENLYTLATSSQKNMRETIPCNATNSDDIQMAFAAIFNQKNNNQTFIIPLVDRNKDPIGVLALLTTEENTTNNTFKRFAQEVSGAIETAIEARLHIDSQNAFIDAVVKLLADAIDAKSPHTGNHCEKVPKLAEMILSAAVSTKTGPYADFSMSSKERREFHIGSWLHDCGKIITPEHIVNKATKLETHYNRIHEIRTRFEVLWRDAEIQYLNGLLEGKDASLLLAEKHKVQITLQQNFELIAEANIGQESSPKETIEQLKKIASTPWLRHFDSTIGLSRDEKALLPTTVPQLPVQEMLLEDKAEHLIPWGDRKPPVEKGNPDNTWGFDMILPRYSDNRGELYNLSIKHGTLTSEERFSINEHSVQTIRMLTALPLPDDLRRVPEIAGNHHERVDGKGYPRKLRASTLSVEERIMAIADVFEALTASDRPYKDAKTLSESLGILATMVKNKHIDAETFQFFVESETYLEYAEAFLKPQQIDPVDKRYLLKRANILSSERQKDSTT